MTPGSECACLFYHKPGVTQSEATASSSCTIASLSSSLLNDVFIRLGFLTVSSVSIHWGETFDIHDYVDMKSKSGIVELLTFSEGLYSGILTFDRILVTISSDTSWETRGAVVREWLHWLER